ncbi:hypothetical protein FRC11_001341 [Ceratobasidium sp. 423]|nr:hypothetical protein FRC11_001341 [Ceratobasidium sp. 423]
MPLVANLKYNSLFRKNLPSYDAESTGKNLPTFTSDRIISLPVGSRFAGRHAGGATRDDVYGESFYGSGYPYGSYGSTWVGGRPFPFFYWPIYIGPYEYYGASEYGPANSTDRPGGPMHTASIFTVDSRYNTSDIYRLLGDRDSVNVVLSTLHDECSVTGGTILGYGPSAYNSSRALPHVESIIQFYRASSFALSLDGYINSAAVVTPVALSNNTGQLESALLPPTPLPSDIAREFLDCINRTVGKSLPLLDPEPGNFPTTNNDPAGAMIACMHLVLLVVLIAGLAKGVTGWLSTPREERASLLDYISDMVSVISAFSN